MPEEVAKPPVTIEDDSETSSENVVISVDTEPGTKPPLYGKRRVSRALF